MGWGWAGGGTCREVGGEWQGVVPGAGGGGECCSGALGGRLAGQRESCARRGRRLHLWLLVLPLLLWLPPLPGNGHDAALTLLALLLHGG